MSFMLSHFKVHDVHGRTEINKLLVSESEPTLLMSISNDPYLSFWEMQTFSLTYDHLLLDSYPLSIVPFKNGYLLGNGHGEIVHLASNGSILSKLRIANDCISDIIVVNSVIIATSHDGTVTFLSQIAGATSNSSQNQTKLAQQNVLQKGQINVLEKGEECLESQLLKMRVVEVDVPINNIVEWQGKLYVSGIKGYMIDESGAHQIGRSDRWIVHKDMVFGCSDERGLFSLNPPVSTFIPCEFMISLGGIIMGFAGNSFTLFSINDSGISWRSWKWEDDTITTAARKGNQLWIGGQRGLVYQVTLNNLE